MTSVIASRVSRHNVLRFVVPSILAGCDVLGGALKGSGFTWNAAGVCRDESQESGRNGESGAEIPDSGGG
ncbi:hypothetical protein, partial [Xanthomonas graminis]|uniref:hypothetical protein n=1 Tax=Xanthomonas graminis TaxID=3390026 RepID=UPI001C400664